MILKTIAIAVIYLFLFFSANIFAQEIKERTETIIKESFGTNVIFTFRKYTLLPEIKRKIENKVQQKFYRDLLYIYKISLKDSVIAYGFLDNVIGKSMPITFFTLLDVDGNIISTDIIKYREPYGGAVSNENWNKQFTGKNSNSDFFVGTSVNGISGATISVNSVTKGIRKITFLYDEIKDEI
jgi:Na+-translocating ferredoxin:NAD+ oxidoreductase RnfG subunit